MICRTQLIAAYFSFDNREETPHGVNSDPLSTAEKGKTIVEESIETLAKFAGSFRKMPLVHC